jgi:hypothetical protein
LLARYDVPSFMDGAWRAGLTTEGLIQQEWFKLLGAGQNIRMAAALPLPLTKRMAHYLLQAPPDFPIMGAFRYGQVLGLGGDARLARSLLASRLGTDFEANEFWETVIRWLIEHPEVEAVHHNPIIDYLHHQKFVASAPSCLGRGQPRLVPPQPHLCMKGRRPESLIRAVERWHRQLWARRGPPAQWKPSGIPPFVVAQTEEVGRKMYALSELISSAELEEEGTAMSHCVANYRTQCESGQSSIWSLTVEDAFGHVQRLLTVEVRNWSREIVQALGKYNQPPQPEQLNILDRWARAGGPRLTYIYIPE